MRASACVAVFLKLMKAQHLQIPPGSSVELYTYGMSRETGALPSQWFRSSASQTILLNFDNAFRNRNGVLAV